VGSGTAVRIAGRHFVFCCRHQVKGYTLDKIAVPLSFDTKIMSVTTIRAAKITDDNRDTDSIDVMAFEFDLEGYGAANLTSEFFPTDDCRVWPTGTAQLPFMVFFYPCQRQLFDEAHIGGRCIGVQAAYDGGSSSPHLQRLKMLNSLDADGMSGGPVFYVGGAPGSYFAGFAGMLMRGGSNTNYLHFMASGWGATAFLLNFVLILGPLLGTVIFLLAGMLSFDSLWWALLPPALYFGIHLLEGETLTPMLLARRFTLNPVLVILSLVFWFWMWGVSGAILAVPLLAILKIICDRLRPLKALGHFLEGE
jgi:AI-2E family transporter